MVARSGPETPYPCRVSVTAVVDRATASNASATAGRVAVTVTVARTRSGTADTIPDPRTVTDLSV